MCTPFRKSGVHTSFPATLVPRDVLVHVAPPTQMPHSSPPASACPQSASFRPPIMAATFLKAARIPSSLSALRRWPLLLPVSPLVSICALERKVGHIVFLGCQPLMTSELMITRLRFCRQGEGEGEGQSGPGPHH